MFLAETQNAHRLNAALSGSSIMGVFPQPSSAQSGSLQSGAGSRNLHRHSGSNPVDAVDSYFECITACSLDDGECVTQCVEVLREAE